jgi:hypothetical protein
MGAVAGVAAVCALAIGIAAAIITAKAAVIVGLDMGFPFVDHLTDQ